MIRLCVRPRQGRQVRHRDQRDCGVWRLPLSQVYRLIKDGRDTTDVRGKNKPTNKMQKLWEDASRSVLKLTTLQMRNDQTQSLAKKNENKTRVVRIL